MRNELILWADDEIDLLKPHILFLKQKGYEVITVSNGRDALEMSEKEHFDLIILDENMPGLSGLETLSRIKETNPDVPVVMITKKRRRKYHDSSHWQQDSRLLDKTCKSESNTAIYQKESLSKRNHLGKSHFRVSARI